jgi:colanic acid/amylovoran biosynthesis protein
MVKKLNIILGNAPINNGNRGCVALSYTSIYLIDKVLSEASIQYNLYMPDSGQVKAGNYVLNH